MKTNKPAEISLSVCKCYEGLHSDKCLCNCHDILSDKKEISLSDKVFDEEWEAKLWVRDVKEAVKKILERIEVFIRNEALNPDEYNLGYIEAEIKEIIKQEMGERLTK